jgi:hypothetical protein
MLFVTSVLAYGPLVSGASDAGVTMRTPATRHTLRHQRTYITHNIQHAKSQAALTIRNIQHAAIDVTIDVVRVKMGACQGVL